MCRFTAYHHDEWSRHTVHLKSINSSEATFTHYFFKYTNNASNENQHWCLKLKNNGNDYTVLTVLLEK